MSYHKLTKSVQGSCHGPDFISGPQGPFQPFEWELLVVHFSCGAQQSPSLEKRGVGCSPWCLAGADIPAYKPCAQVQTAKN